VVSADLDRGGAQAQGVGGETRCPLYTIGQKKRFNSRIAGKTEAEYAHIMNTLSLPTFHMMDVAVAANLACGRRTGA
jgi:hypothetical protein